jgi:hypothetical protein
MRVIGAGSFGRVSLARYLDSDKVGEPLAARPSGYSEPLHCSWMVHIHGCLARPAAVCLVHLAMGALATLRAVSHSRRARQWFPKHPLPA